MSRSDPRPLPGFAPRPTEEARARLLEYLEISFLLGDAQLIEGGVLCFLDRPANLPMIGGQFLTAKREFIAKERKLAIGFARSVAKASVFLGASPEAGARAFLKMYPETAPRGAEQADAVKAIVYAIAQRIKLYTPPYAGTKMGRINPQEFITEADLSGLPKIADFANFYTNDMIDEINALDAAKIVAAAKGYTG